MVGDAVNANFQIHSQVDAYAFLVHRKPTLPVAIFLACSHFQTMRIKEICKKIPNVLGNNPSFNISGS